MFFPKIAKIKVKNHYSESGKNSHIVAIIEEDIDKKTNIGNYKFVPLYPCKKFLTFNIGLNEEDLVKSFAKNRMVLDSQGFGEVLGETFLYWNKESFELLGIEESNKHLERYKELKRKAIAFKL